MRRLARIMPSAAALSLLTLLASSRVALAASHSTCVNGGRQNPDIAAEETVLQRSPTRLGKRMELAHLLEKAGCYEEAVHLLEEGQRYNPFNPTLLFSLRRARNMAKEEHYLEGKLQALQPQRQSTQRKDAIAPAARSSSLGTLGRAPGAPARTQPTAHKEQPTQVAAVSADAEAMVEPQDFSNVAEASRSN